MVGLDKKVKNKTGIRDWRVKNWDMLQAGMGLMGNPQPGQLLQSVVQAFGGERATPGQFLGGLMSLWS